MKKLKEVMWKDMREKDGANKKRKKEQDEAANSSVLSSSGNPTEKDANKSTSLVCLFVCLFV